jgi:hypothetical protein
MMTFDPERWLDVANACRKSMPNVDREALLRTVMNRAYYAALLSFKQRIESVNGPGTLPSRRTHDAIFRAIGAGGATFEDSYRTLRRLRRKRETADYKLNTRPTRSSDAREAVRLSRWLIRDGIKALPDAAFRALKVPRT